MRVPFVDLGRQFESFQEEIVKSFVNLSSKGQYVMGAQLDEFERDFAQYCQVKHALGVGNGTDALILVLKAWGIGPGDEVITAPNSFIASAGAIAAVGARPVFCDIDQTLNMNPEALAAAITEKTKVIMPVHFTGLPANMKAVTALADKHNLKILEDSAQAIGATYEGRPVGGLGHAAAFSLHPLKNFHIQGDGGVITTDDTELYTQIKSLRNHGLVDRDHCDHWGLNSRLDNLQAAIGCIKLKKMAQITKRFQQIAQTYFAQLKDLPGVELPLTQPPAEGVYHNFILRVQNRPQFQKELAEKGVDSKVHYPVPIHLQKAAEGLGYSEGSFPITEKLAKEILSLPIYAELTDEEVNWVCQCVQEVAHHLDK